MMKFKIIFFFAIFAHYGVLAQQDNNNNYFSENYVNINTISVNGIYDSRFGNESEEKIRKGISFDAVSLHGLFFFKYFALSAGLGVNYNTVENFAVLPVVGDLRIFTTEKGVDDAFFGFLQLGKNIKIGNVFMEGRPVKVGVGSTFQKNDDIQLVLELFKKYEETMLPDEEYRFDVSSYGVSLGIKF